MKHTFLLILLSAKVPCYHNKHDKSDFWIFKADAPKINVGLEMDLYKEDILIMTAKECGYEVNADNLNQLHFKYVGHNSKP